MASTPYFDRVLTKSELQRVLTQAGGKHSPERSKPSISVYKLSGEGEGMVEAAGGGKYRLRLYRGKCAC
jgi:hypothetical protein